MADKEKLQVTEEEYTDSYVVGAFLYTDADRADRAVKEQQRIEKLTSQVDYSKPKVVYALYLKILEGGVFETPEGISYLVKLNEYLTSQQMAIGKEIPPIPEELLCREVIVEKSVVVPGKKKRELTIWKRIKENREDPAIYKMIIAFLIVGIIVMLVLTGLSDSPNILNYKKKIQNEYSEWATQLEQKEAELNARERKLNQVDDY